MPYLNLDLNYFTHPKTRRLIGLLGRGSEVLPIRLWCHCGAHHCDAGKLADYSPQEIESIVEWWGKPGEMLQAFLRVGFILKTRGGFEIPGWREYQGHIAAFKAKGKAMADARWKKARDADSNATSMLQALPEPTEPTNGKEQQTNNPRGRPASLSVVLSAAATAGCPPAEAERFWHHFEASGWVDKNGNPVRNWQSKLATWSASARAKPAETAHKNGESSGPSTTAELILRQKELDRAENRIRTIRESYDSHQSPTPSDQDALNKLYKRKRELKKILGIQI